MRRIARFRALAFVVLCAAAASGCDPEFDAPLSDGRTSEVDEELLGTWYFVSDSTPAEEESPLLKISRENKSNALRLDWGPRRQAKKGGDTPELPDEVFTTKAGGRRFMSVLAALPNEKKSAQQPPTRYEVYAYRTRGDSLEVFMLDADAIGNAIQASKLRGSAERQRGLLRTSRYKSVRVTDAPKKALEFLAANFDACVTHGPAFRLTRTAAARPKRNEHGKKAGSPPEYLDERALPKAHPDEISQRLVGTWTTQSVCALNLLGRLIDEREPWLLVGSAQIDLRADGTMVLSWVVNGMTLGGNIRNWRVTKTEGNRETVTTISKSDRQEPVTREWGVTLLSDGRARVEDRKGQTPPFILTKSQ